MRKTRKQKFYSALTNYSWHITFLDPMPLEDRALCLLLNEIDDDILYRNPEFNKQLRIRMKHYNLKWINKKD